MLFFTCAFFSLSTNLYAQCINGLSFGNLETDSQGPTIKGLRLPTQPGDIASYQYLLQASSTEGGFAPVNNYRILNPDSDLTKFPHTRITIDKKKLVDDLGFLVPDFHKEEAVPRRFSDDKPVESEIFFLINDYRLKQDGTVDTEMGMQWLYAIPPDANNTGAIRPSQNVNTGNKGGVFYRFRDGIHYTQKWSPWIRLDNREIQSAWVEIDSIQINDQKIRSLANSLDIAVKDFSFDNNQLKNISSAEFAHFRIESDAITGTNASEPVHFTSGGTLSITAPFISFNQGNLSRISSIDQLEIYQQNGFRTSSGSLALAGGNGYVNFISNSITALTSVEDLDIDKNSLTTDSVLTLVADTNEVDFQNSRLINLAAIEDIDFATGHNRTIATTGSSHNLRLDSATQEINFYQNRITNWQDFRVKSLQAEQAKIGDISFYATGLTSHTGDLKIKVAQPEDRINLNYQTAKLKQILLEGGVSNPLALLNMATSTIQVTRHDTENPLSIDSLADAINFNNADIENIKSISASSVVASGGIFFPSVEIISPNTITTNIVNLDLGFSAVQNIVLASDFVVQDGVSSG